MKADSDWARELGFGEVIEVNGRYSVAEQFPVSHGRCGIYLLEFASGLFYIGQATDVVRRFAQHQHAHGDIARLRFQKVRAAGLNAREQALIHEAERRGVRLTNIIHASVTHGESDLDLLLAPEEQESWLAGGAPYAPEARYLLPPDDVRRLRGRKNWQKMQQHPGFAQALDLARGYVRVALPAPARTELSHWSVSCMPSTNASFAPRILVVNVYKMETLVIMYDPQRPESLHGFINLTRSAVEQGRWQLNVARVRWFRRGTLLRRSSYRSAGQDQLAADFQDYASGMAVLADPLMGQAMRSMTLSLMRKGPNLQYRHHNYDLADALFAATEQKTLPEQGS